MLQNELLSSISSGAIQAGDEEALSAALDSIDATLRSSRPAGGGKPPSPDEMKTKIESLIDDQVDSGKLTADQAEELKNVFANAMPQGGPGGRGGPGGPSGPGGGGILGASGSEDESTDVVDLISDFIKLLQEAKGTQGYGEQGDKLLSQISSLVVDYQA